MGPGALGMCAQPMLELAPLFFASPLLPADNMATTIAAPEMAGIFTKLTAEGALVAAPVCACVHVVAAQLGS